MLYGFFLAWLWLFVIIITIITPQHVRFSSMYLYAIAWNLDGIPSIVIVRDLFLAVAFALIWPMLPTGTIHHVLCISDFDLMRRVILSRLGEDSPPKKS